MKSAIIKSKVFIEELEQTIELKIYTTTDKKYYITAGQHTKPGKTVLYLQGNVRTGFKLTKQETAKFGTMMSDNTIIKLLGLEEKSQNDWTIKYHAKHLKGEERKLSQYTPTST
jgi:hypothetical protein